MIEIEAKTKWCPFAQIDGMNRYPNGKPATRCVGSDCMMWRWDEGGRKFGNDATHGYCGLAGEPQ